MLASVRVLSRKLGSPDQIVGDLRLLDVAEAGLCPGRCRGSRHGLRGSPSCPSEIPIRRAPLSICCSDGTLHEAESEVSRADLVESGL